MNLIWIIFSIILLISFIGFHTTIPTPLFADDAKNHWDFIHTTNCVSGYPNGLCLMLQWANLSPWGNWGLFFGLSLLIPLLITIYCKEVRFFPLFFVFTGVFWNTMLMQVFAQIFLSVFFVFFLFHNIQKHRLIVLDSLLFLLLIGVKFHNQEFMLLLGILIIELFILLKDSALQYFDEHPECLGVCGLLPVNSVKKISKVTSGIRDPMAQGVNNFNQAFIYYFYSFFVENMFIGFVVPGVYYIFKHKMLRFIAYLFFVLISAFVGWVYLDFEIWYVTRILIWLPLVLFVPFVRWLDCQCKFTKIVFYFFGFGYFCFNVWFFLLKMQELACVV